VREEREREKESDEDGTLKRLKIEKKEGQPQDRRR